MHLWCEFFVSWPMFEEGQLDGLQGVINKVLPVWSSELRAAKDEDSRDTVFVGREGRLYDGIHRMAAPKRRLGDAILTGASQGLSFFLSHCQGTLPPELNDVSIEVYGPLTVEGQPTSVWARKAFEAVVAALPVRYGNAHTSEEFAAKNMLDDENGVRAMGRLLERSLPGLYWLNYFGAPYVDLIGRERLLSSPGYEVQTIVDGVLVALDASSETWPSAAYQEREQAVIAHLGKQYFFSREDPSRQTVAPNFR